MDPYAHPTRQPSRPRTMPFSVQLQDRTTLYHLIFLELAPFVVLVHSTSLAARYRVAACSTTLSQDFEKIETARGHNCAPSFALSPVWALWNVSFSTLTFGRQCLSIGFFTRPTESSVYSMRLNITEGTKFSVTTTAVIGAAQVSACLRVTLALTGK